MTAAARRGEQVLLLLGGELPDPRPENRTILVDQSDGGYSWNSSGGQVADEECGVSDTGVAEVLARSGRGGRENEPHVKTGTLGEFGHYPLEEWATLFTERTVGTQEDEEGATTNLRGEPVDFEGSSNDEPSGLGRRGAAPSSKSEEDRDDD